MRRWKEIRKRRKCHDRRGRSPNFKWKRGEKRERWYRYHGGCGCASLSSTQNGLPNEAPINGGHLVILFNRSSSGGSASLQKEKTTGK